MVGTLFNTVTVLVGASAGLALGARWSLALRDKVFVAIGLFTLVLGVLMATETAVPVDMFLALILGTALGHRVGLQRRLDAVLARVRGEGPAPNGQAPDGPGAASPGAEDAEFTPATPAATQRPKGGFVEAMLLFCLGSMTLVGCMEDGLQGKPDLLLVKGTMDLISSAFLAATLGRGVLWAAAGVFAFQGALTWAFRIAGHGMSNALVQELGAVGGVLMLGLGFQLLGMRGHGRTAWPLLDMLPALLVLPAVRWAHDFLLTFVG
jgi:uncharacterized membrane protein YqgA involved in biofilm formation